MKSSSLRRLSENENRFDRKIRFGPVSYVIRDVWRNRSRTMMSIYSIAALAFLFVIFMSMDRGFQEFFEDDTGVPTEEQKDLYEVKGVMENWVYLITTLCLVLMVLVVANTGIITVVERRKELASLRAMGIPSGKVGSLVAMSLAMILYGGILMGLLLGLAAIPLLDRVNFTIGAEGIGFPFAFDWRTVVYIFLIGTVAGTIGFLMPLSLMMRSSPLEVLRDG
jgi:predicted lysophospholipase L1 biosynthesis ABC-type transport system permease subunit